MHIRSRAAAAIAACAAFLIPLGEVRAQDTAAVRVEAPDTLRASYAEDAASPPLPVDHWAARAAARAQALGFTREFLPAQRALPRATVARALREAAETARDANPAVAALADGWQRRFAEEFREFGARAAVKPFVLGGSASLEGERWAGRVRPASGMYGYRVDPAPLADDGGVAVAVAPALGWKHLYLAVDGRMRTDESELRSWGVGAQVGRWALSVGKEPAAYGYGRTGGLLLSGVVPLQRVQLQTVRPFRLPWVLDAIGSTSFHTMLTRFDEDRHPGDPWFWSARMGFEPHRRLTVGISRASIFGGDHIDTPVTLGNVGKMFLGVLSKEFENQIVAVDARWRLPTDRTIPLTAYMEWGSEDASGAWWTVPGRVAGIMTPSLPGVPQLAAGVEVAHFAPLCCGNPPWYFHGGHYGDWVYGELPLGHPLGGEGWEVAAYGEGDLLASRLRVDGRAFARRRGEEGFRDVVRAGNLYAPLRGGHSVGATLDASLRLMPRIELRTRLRGEAGREWSEQQLRLSASYLF